MKKANDIIFNNLIRKVVIQDDEKAFKELFLEFYSTLCVFASHYIPDQDVTRDIVQEVFFKIWKNRKNICIETSFRNLLITNVRNSCLDYLRKKEIENVYIEKNKTVEMLDSPEEVYTLNELEIMIGEALAKLPPKVREAFELNRFKGLTYKEIATEMVISPKTVEAYIGKALKILREELKDYLPFLLLFL